MQAEKCENTISGRIKFVRKELGLTQAQFAELLDISDQGSISRVEKGTKKIDSHFMTQLIEKCNFNINWLITGVGPKHINHQSDISSIHSAKGKPIGSVNNYEEIHISEKLTKTAEVLESDTLYRAALAANIDAFHHAVRQEHVVHNQQQRITNLETRVAALEKLLASATASPDAHASKAKKDAA